MVLRDTDFCATSQAVRPPKHIPSWGSNGLGGDWSFGWYSPLLRGFEGGDIPDWEPAKFDLISLIIFCFLGLAVCLLPWENYQVKIAKIGPFELREALSAQAQEREFDIHELSKHIEKLEGAAPGGDDEAPAAAAESNTLLGLLKNFFKDNERYSFNASRIWSRDPNNFGSFETSEIRRALRETVSEGAAETRVSQKGNTLYRAAKK